MTPTIGRIVLFRSKDVAHFPEDDECPAIVTKVWSDTCVSLTVFRDMNTPVHVSSCQLAEDLASSGHLYCWSWMPYQQQVSAGLIEPGGEPVTEPASPERVASAAELPAADTGAAAVQTEN